MRTHDVRVHPSSSDLPREEQLAWAIAEVATDPVAVDAEVAEMVVNRFVDNAAAAAAALTAPPRRPPGPRRSPTRRGPAAPVRPSSEWPRMPRSARSGRPRRTGWRCASWTTTTRTSPRTTRTRGQHPSAARRRPARRRDGQDLVRAIATGYEVQIDLVRSISLHEHKIDHVAHLGPSVAAGLGTLLDLPHRVVYHAVGQALHTTTSTRQSRKGQISSWKAFAPALAGSWPSRRWTGPCAARASPDPDLRG